MPDTRQEKIDMIAKIIQRALDESDDYLAYCIFVEMVSWDEWKKRRDY